MIWEHKKHIWKITTGQGDNDATGFLLDYLYFKNLVRW